MIKQNKKDQNNKINKVEETKNIISGRGGLAAFNRYLEKILILDIFQKKFGSIRKSSKGLPISMLFKQILCWLFDGSSRHISFFDHLKKDKGYAATIETEQKSMASSHSIKRFFQSFNIGKLYVYRQILQMLFVWRLKIEKPLEIRLYLDSMVMDNDDAKKRQGVQPTYKKVLGFKPLQILWNNRIVDCIFRGGKINCNNGDAVVNMVTRIVKLIREKYRDDVLIVLHLDSGFFDELNFMVFDSLNIAFIASGKMYEGVKEYAKGSSSASWDSYKNGKNIWKFIEFGFRCNNWLDFYRAIYTHSVCEDNGQMLFSFARPDNVILTNIGINEKLFELCSPERKDYWLKNVNIIESYHQCGKDELTHRKFKNFGFEQLPFENFYANASLYYCMVIGYFIFESFKQDVLHEVLPIESYANTVRRIFVDIAAQIVKTSRSVILKLRPEIMKRLKFKELWEKCQNPVPIIQ